MGTPVEQIAKAFGSQLELARICGVSRSCVSHWKRPASQRGRDGRIPDAYFPAIRRAAEERGKVVTADMLIGG